MALELNEEKKENKEFEKKDLGRLDDGTYIGIVHEVIDLGRQYKTNYKTGEREKWDDGNDKINREVWIGFEYPTERTSFEDKDGEVHDVPRVLGRRVTIPKNISIADKSYLKKLFDAASIPPRSLPELIGKTVMNTIGTTSGGKAKITASNKLMKGISIPDSEMEPLVFDLDDFNEETWKKIPKFIQEIIKSGPDWDEGLLNEVDGDDVPF